MSVKTLQPRALRMETMKLSIQETRLSMLFET